MCYCSLTLLLKAKELRCDDIVAIDSGTDTKAAQFPITIQFKGPKRQKLYLRAQSKVSQTKHMYSTSTGVNLTGVKHCVYLLH